MCSPIQKEQISISKICLYIDSTKSLRAHLSSNDRMPIWDGEVLVYEGFVDKNANLTGKVMVQAKSKEVIDFRNFEEYYVPIVDIHNYMRSGGILFFVVELQPEKGWTSKIFYRLLSPVVLKTLYKKYHNKQKSVKIRLATVPVDNNKFEIELKNFLHDSIKQQSFVNKPTLLLKDVLEKSNTTTIKSSFVTKEIGDWSWQISAQPIYLYKQTPYADIPIGDAEFYAEVKNVYFNSVSINGTKYFDKYYLRIGYGYVDILIEDCLTIHTPRKGFEDGFRGQLSTNYRFRSTIEECLHKLYFLRHAVSSNSITLADTNYPLCLTDEMQKNLLEELKNNIDFYEDLKNAWHLLHIPFNLDFCNYEDEIFGQFENLVEYVYRRKPCLLINDNGGKDESFSLFSFGNLNFLFFAKRDGDGYFNTIDPFTTAGLQVGSIDKGGRPMPLLSVALRNISGYLFDNIYYESQLEFYKYCYSINTSFRQIIIDDIDMIRKILPQVKPPQKQQKVSWFLGELSKILE